MKHRDSGRGNATLRAFAALLTAALLTVSCAGAESLFSLTATPTPEPTATPASTAVYEQPEAKQGLFDQLATATPAPARTPVPEPAETPAPVITNEQAEPTQGMFDQLVTATPSPTPTPTPEATPTPDATEVPEADPAESSGVPDLTGGLGYGSLTGKEADNVYEDADNHRTQYVFEQVTEEDFKQYGIFLSQQGCLAAGMETETQNAVSYQISRQEDGFGFLAVYQPDRQILTLVFSGTAGDNRGGEDAEQTGESAEPAENTQTDEGGTAGPAGGTTEKTQGSAEETRESTTETSARHSVEVCSHCKNGYCKECHGAGWFKCSYCHGGGGCPTCHGTRGKRIPGYGGVGTSTFVTCSDCGGSGRCRKCNGRGKEDCPDCDHGVCPYCHGNYVLDP